MSEPEDGKLGEGLPMTGGDLVGGDQITVGDLEGSNIAIGRDAKVEVQSQSEEEKLRDYLAKAVANYKARINQAVVRGSRRPEEPYKSLYAFEIEDSNIFFGRDAASEALHEKVLEDLTREEIELPHLQLVCTQLFESFPAGRREILLEDYEEFGRTAGVLGGYLKKTLDGLPHEQREAATAVLKALVSSENTKRMMSEAELAARFGDKSAVLETVLMKLVEKRLLRRDEKTGKIVYELAHEILIEEIRSWYDESDIRDKQAEERLAREVANWRIYGINIPKERLELLYEHRGAFEVVDSDTAALLVNSVVAAGLPIEDWITFLRPLGEPAVEPLIAALKDEDEKVREAAVATLGTLGDKRTVEPLIAALKDENELVRKATREALEKLGWEKNS